MDQNMEYIIQEFGPMVIGRSIWITFQREGIHCYPEALTDPKLADVSFLGHPHRHIFHFRVEVPVAHDNRDIEFILFKRWCINLFEDGILELDNQSCEMIANNLGEEIIDEWDVDWVNVMVSEDNENGATIVIENNRPIKYPA